MGISDDSAIGCDIEEIDRFKLDRIQDEQFLKRVFTEAELEYCFSFSKPAPHLAARFCAKEAVVKSLSSIGIGSIDYREIQIEKEDNGVPVINILHQKTNDLLKGRKVKISLSHSRTTAMAVAMIPSPDR